MKNSRGFAVIQVMVLARCIHLVGLGKFCSYYQRSSSLGLGKILIISWLPLPLVCLLLLLDNFSSSWMHIFQIFLLWPFEVCPLS